MTRLTIVCISFIFCCLMFAGQSSAGIDPETCVGMWLFDKNTNDSSGNGNDGTLIGDQKWVDGNSGKALDFDGVGDWVDCGNEPEFNITDTITISAWVYQREQGSSWNGIVSKTDSNTNGWEIRTMQAGSNNIQCRILNGSDGGPSTTLTNKVWSHVVGTYDGSIIRLYVNGVQKSTAPQNGIATNSRSLSIGKLAYANLFFNGTIDEVAVFNVALTENDITSIMTKGLEAIGAAVSPSGKLATTWAEIKCALE